MVKYLWYQQVDDRTCSNELDARSLRRFLFTVFIRRGREVLASKGFSDHQCPLCNWPVVMPTSQGLVCFAGSLYHPTVLT